MIIVIFVKKTDFLLLTDIFEKYFNLSLKYYGLDPCHYFRSPGLSWDEILKITETKLELILGSNMHYFIEEWMRGGISYIAKIYSKGNNKYMQFYGDKNPSKFIMYLDANNLYGWATSQYLPYGEF